METKTYKPLLILTLAEQLIVDAQPQLNKVPKSQRYRYGKALEEMLYVLPGKIIEAASGKTKTKVYALCDHLRLLSSHLRIGAEAGYIKPQWMYRINRTPSETDSGGELMQINAIAFSWRSRLKGN